MKEEHIKERGEEQRKYVEENKVSKGSKQKVEKSQEQKRSMQKEENKILIKKEIEESLLTFF